MASGDLLKNLFISYKQGNEERFYAIAREIIASELKKKHSVLARDLQRILENGTSKPISALSFPSFEKLPQDKERGASLIEIRSVERFLDDIVLSETVMAQVKTIIREYSAKEHLSIYGFHPKRKLLFAGPPGCGKTLCAEIIAGEIGLPILYTRFDAVISSYLGETASNLRRIFDFAAKGTWVIFFDEFDAIGKSRDDPTEHGELKRVVNTFLQLLDSFQSESIFIAATNHEKLLDRALWRRFDDILFLNPPTQEQILQVIKLKLRNFPHSIDYESFVKQMIGWSHADIERVCTEAMKISILENENKVKDSIFSRSLQQQAQRIEIISKTSPSSN